MGTQEGNGTYRAYGTYEGVDGRAGGLRGLWGAAGGEFAVDAGAVDAQEAGGFGDVAVGLGEGALDELFFGGFDAEG
jgi:hypothetical protein